MELIQNYEKQKNCLTFSNQKCSLLGKTSLKKSKEITLLKPIHNTMGECCAPTRWPNG